MASKYNGRDTPPRLERTSINITLT